MGELLASQEGLPSVELYVELKRNFIVVLWLGYSV